MCFDLFTSYCLLGLLKHIRLYKHLTFFYYISSTPEILLWFIVFFSFLLQSWNKCLLFSHFSNRPLRFAIGLPATMENKENAHPYGSSNRDDSSNDSDQSDGPILYRDEPPVQEQRQAKIARKESLSLKLAMRPNVDELISRNILHMQSENERQESKEAIGARLIRRLSMRPTPEELIERNILKSSKTPPQPFTIQNESY